MTQHFPEGERVIQYLSKQLSGAQLNWSVIEKEAYAIIFAVSKLRCFLYGSKFTVFTDHKPLKSLFTSEMKNLRVQRWAIILSEYDCTFEYKTGRSNVAADWLSRLTTPDNPGNNDDVNYGPDEEIIGVINSQCASAHVSPQKTVQIEKVQLDDIDLPSLIELQQKAFDTIIHSLEINTDFVMDGGILYHVNSKAGKTHSPPLQVAIPAEMSESILQRAHESPFEGGHLGVERTFNKIQQRFWWPRMHGEVTKFVLKCMTCLTRRTRIGRAPLQTMPEANFPFDIIGIDTCGPYPDSVNGNKYIVTIVDHFSGWPEAYPIPNKQADTVASLLMERFLPIHACPTRIISDRGGEFNNYLIQTLTSRMKIKHIRSAPWRPQFNGKTERFHRYLNDCIAKYTRGNHGLWEQHLPGILMAYRTSTHSSTKFTPYFLVYGRDPILPMDTLLCPKLKYLGDEYVPTMLQSLHVAFSEAKHNMASTREKNKALFNKTATTRAFKPGDAVYFYDPAIDPSDCPKWAIKWKPYYRVLDQISPVTFRIKHQLSDKSRIAHANNLLPAHVDDSWDIEYEQAEPLVQLGASRIAVPPVRIQPTRATRLTCTPAPPLNPSSQGPITRNRSRLMNTDRPMQPSRKRNRSGESDIETDSHTQRPRLVSTDLPPVGQPSIVSPPVSHHKRHVEESNFPESKRPRTGGSLADNDDIALSTEHSSKRPMETDNAQAGSEICSPIKRPRHV